MFGLGVGGGAVSVWVDPITQTTSWANPLVSTRFMWPLVEKKINRIFFLFFSLKKAKIKFQPTHLLQKYFFGVLPHLWLHPMEKKMYELYLGHASMSQ